MTRTTYLEIHPVALYLDVVMLDDSAGGKWTDWDGWMARRRKRRG